MMNRDIKMIFADNLKKLRKGRNETVTELAEVLGVAQSTISDWENAKKMPRAGAIEKIGEHYNINKSDLLRDTSEIKENFIPYDTNQLQVPVYGDIAAGALATIDGIKNAEKISIPRMFLGKHQNSSDLFAMKVNGDSMDNIIPNDSYVVAKPINPLDLKDEDIVIFSHDGEYSMKRYRFDEEDQVIVFSPESANKKFRDIVIPFDTQNDLKIYAKVIWYSVNLD